jgi:hypothetical protein
MFTFCVAPVQPLNVGATVYATTWLFTLVLFNTSFSTTEVFGERLSPVTFALLDANQLKVLLGMVEVNANEGEMPLQMVSVPELVILGFGLT